MAAGPAVAFRREFIELLGSRPDERDVATAESRLEGQDRAGIRRYISSLPQFRDKYEDMISRVYTINCDALPDEETIRFFLQRFATPDYGPDDLAEDIAKGATPDRAKALEAPEEHPGFSERDSMLSFARRWEGATGEKIDVYEFIRYYEEDPDKATIRRLADSQESALLYVDKVHRDYLGRGVTKDEFLERYMFEHDKPHFDAEVMATVLEGAEYGAGMRKQICASHHRMFGADMHPDDVEHVFLVVKGRRACLYSEEIAEELIRTSDALRGISDQVGAVYRATLEREPDPDEVRECVPDFRAYGAERAVSELKSRLHGSLEFHDVIKDRFRASFEKKHGRCPRPKEVYDGLSVILRENASDMSRALDGI